MDVQERNDYRPKCRDHFDHYKQVVEWHMEMERNKDQLSALYSNRSLQFQQWLDDRKKAIKQSHELYSSDNNQ